MQQSTWNERLHPRGSDGRFIDKAGGILNFHADVDAADKWLRENLADDWAENLTLGESVSIDEYTNFTYEVIQSYLQGKISKEDTANQERDVDRTIAGLDSAIAKSGLPEGLRVRRGMTKGSLPDVENAIENGTPADVIDNVYEADGFMSTSVDPGVAVHFTRDGGFIQLIDLPRDHPAAYVPAARSDTSEHELLLPRGMQLRIKEIDTSHRIPLVIMEPTNADIRSLPAPGTSPGDGTT